MLLVATCQGLIGHHLLELLATLTPTVLVLTLRQISALVQWWWDLRVLLEVIRVTVALQRIMILKFLLDCYHVTGDACCRLKCLNLNLVRDCRLSIWIGLVHLAINLRLWWRYIDIHLSIYIVLSQHWLEAIPVGLSPALLPLIDRNLVGTGYSTGVLGGSYILLSGFYLLGRAKWR